MLFLHGFTDSWRSYSRVLEGLPPHIRAIVPTQRGHGELQRPACCYRVSDFSGDAAAVRGRAGYRACEALSATRWGVSSRNVWRLITRRV